jgi:hypothetical protein
VACAQEPARDAASHRAQSDHGNRAHQTAIIQDDQSAGRCDGLDRSGELAERRIVDLRETRARRP